jgi:polyhydroxyalkanoate synthesis regulator phasin
MMENFTESYAGTDLAPYAERIDWIVEMVQDGQLTKDDAAELIEDIKTEQAIANLTSDITLRNNFIKAADLLMKVL